MSGTPLLTAAAVRRDFGSATVLGPLDFEVTAGDSVALVGPNGAGKTTLLRLAAGVLVPSAGALSWRGEPFSRLSRRDLARRIAYVPQVRPTDVPLNVEQMVLLGRHPHLGPWQLAPSTEDLDAVERALEMAGLTGLRSRSLATLSGGERQGVYIAAALAQEAELLVLDEPATHLDPAHRRQVAALIERLHRVGGRTVVTATHDLVLASRVADRVVALKGGRVLASGPPEEVLEPDTLSDLFDAPFELARAGGRGRRRTVPLVDYSSGAGR